MDEWKDASTMTDLLYTAHCDTNIKYANSSLSYLIALWASQILLPIKKITNLIFFKYYTLIQGCMSVY